MKFTEKEVMPGFYGYFRYPYPSGNLRTVIFKVPKNGTVNASPAITITDGKFDYVKEFGASHNNHDQDQRPATAEEIAWLDACIEAGKFVKKPEVYEIY